MSKMTVEASNCNHQRNIRGDSRNNNTKLIGRNHSQPAQGIKRSADSKDINSSSLKKPCTYSLPRGQISPRNMENHATNTIQAALGNFSEGKKVIDQQLKQIAVTNRDELILFIGNTGAGKSTLINYLSGAELFATGDAFAGYKITAKNPVVDIGNSSTISETSIPTLHRGNSGLIYCDLPGFEDSRGDAHKIANACLIKEIVSKVRSVKLVMVSSEGGLSEQRSNYFRNSIEQIGELIGSNFDSLSLVVTSAKSSLEEVKTTLSDIAKENAESRQFIGKLTDHIALFNCPKTSGLMGEEDKEAIFKQIKANKAIRTNTLTIHVPLSEDLKAAVEALGRESNKEINRATESIFTKLKNKILKKIGNSNISNIEDLKKLSTLISSLKTLVESDTASNNLNSFIRGVRHYAKKLKIHCGNLREKSKELSFLSEILREDLFTKETCVQGLAKIISDLPKNLATKMEDLNTALDKQKVEEGKERDQAKREVTKPKPVESRPAPRYDVRIPRYTNEPTPTPSTPLPTPTQPSAPKKDTAPTYRYKTEIEEYWSPGPGDRDYYDRIPKYYRINNNTGKKQEISKEQYFRESGEEESSCIVS